MTKELTPSYTLPKKRLFRRHLLNRLFALVGQLAVFSAVGILVSMLVAIVWWALPTFTSLALEVTIPSVQVSHHTFSTSSSQDVVSPALHATFPILNEPQFNHPQYERQAERLFSYLLFREITSSQESAPLLRASPNTTAWVTASQEVVETLSHPSPHHVKLSSFQKALLHTLEDNEKMRWQFNWYFFTGSDAQNSEICGIWGALLGTLYALGVALCIALPIGVGTAIYLQEIAKDSSWTRFVGVNLNNLAAVPSVVFGLLGLALFLTFLKLPRSSALVGGLTLGLMFLPIIIVSTRSSLKAVPKSLRHAALALGASSSQVIFHQVFPLALPGILTGIFLGIARIMGESACLLLVGMMAFIPSPPTSLLSPTTVLPLQIYQWVERPEKGFDELSSAAILILLLLLGGLSWIALFLKSKFEKKW